MNKFLCTLTAVVAVANAYSIGGGSYGGSSAIGGLAYQQLPAVSLSLIPVHGSGYGPAPSAGYGAAPSIGYGSVPAYGASAPLAYKVISAPAPAPYSGGSSYGGAAGGVDADALNLAHLALQLPVPAGVLDGGVGPAVASNYGAAPAHSSYGSAPSAGYGASAPAAAQSASAAAAASWIGDSAPAHGSAHGGSAY